MDRPIDGFSKKNLPLAETEKAWKALLAKIERDFGGDVDLQAVLFLVGIQELGKGYRKYSKDQKLEVLHIAICTLLEPFGYYEFEGYDQEGYPHWKQTENLPALNPGQQLLLMKQALISYFETVYGEKSVGTI
jgi:hypothetical protein